MNYRSLTGALVRSLFIAAAIPLIAAAQPSDANDAAISSTLGPDGGNIVVEAHGVQPKVPLLFNASVNTQVNAAPDEISETMNVHLAILQGHPEVLTLGLFGNGEITDVSGAGLRDWAVRQGDGRRYLDLRPALTQGQPDPKQLDIVVHASLRKPQIPGDCAILIPIPGDASGFTSQIFLAADDALDLQVTDATGLLPLSMGAPSQPGFVAIGDARLIVTLRQRGAGAPAAELLNPQLTGAVNDAGQCVDFHLTARAHVTGANARLALLSGAAALSGTAAGDGWHIALAPAANGPAYFLFFDHPGDFAIDLPFSAALRTDGDWRGLDFHMNAGVVVPLLLQGLPPRIEFNPASAVVPGPAPEGWRGFLPSDGSATLAWKPSSEAGEGTLFFTGSEETDVRVGSGLLRQDSQITLRVLQGRLPAVRLLLDGPGEILDVQGSNVVGWKVSQEGKQRFLDVRLSRPIETAESLVVRSQDAFGSFPVHAQSLRLTPVGAVRHSGFIRVSNDGAVRLEVADTSGMMQLAPAQFPGQALDDSTRQVFVYRFASADYTYSINADQIVPEVNVSQIATYEIGETDRAITADIELDIREAPLREWNLQIPADYAVVSVTGNDIADYVPETGAASGLRNLKLIFDQPIDGRQLIHLRLEKNQSAAAGQWRLPPLLYPGAKSVRGHVGVVSIPGFRIAPQAVNGLAEVPLSYFPAQTAGLQQAWRIRDPSWTAAAQVTALAQSVQADVFHLYSLKQGVVYGSVLINYFVVGAPANEWRIAVPKAAGNIDVVGQNVRREWRREGDQIIVTLHQPVLGPATLLVTFEEPMSARGGVIDPGEVTPLDVQGERGYIQVVSPLEVKYEITKADPSLLKLEPLELPAEYRLLTTSPSLVIYQYTARPFTLEMNVDWYVPAETAGQVVDFARLSSHISRDGQVVTDVHYFVKTRGQKDLRMVLPDGVTLWEARVGNDVVNARADSGETLIPLPPRMNPNDPVEVTLRLGQIASSASRPRLAAPRMLVPTVISQWTLHADPDRLLVPRGGSAELRGPNLTETGFEWVAARGRAAVVTLLAAVALAAALAGRNTRLWQQLACLAICLAAIYIAVNAAVDAHAIRRVNSAMVSYAATVLPAGDPVTIDVANLPVWRAMISWPGILAALAGAALLLHALLALLRAEKKAASIALGAILLSAGLLAQRGGAILFFIAATVGVIGLQAIPALRRLIVSLNNTIKARHAIPGAAISPLVAIAVSVAMLLPGVPHLHAADNLPMIPANPPNPVSAESIIQTWKIQKHRLFGGMDISIRGVPGQSFLLLNSPAVLTGFQGDGLRVAKVSRDGAVAYYVAPERPGLLTGHATFELPVPDISQGITLPTGPAAIQRVTIDLDQSGWEFASPAAVSVLPTAGLPPGESGATLILAPMDNAAIQFHPKGRDAATETTEFYAELSNLFVAGPGVVNGFHRVTIRPAQGRVSGLDFDVPAGFTVGDVKNGPAGVWRFDPRTRKLHVNIEPAQEQAFELDIETQLGIDALPAQVTLEPVRIEAAAGEIGMIGLAFGSDAQPEALQPKGLSPINIDDFDSDLIPQGQDGNPVAVLQQVYRYGAEGGSVTLKVAPVAPEVRVTTSQVLSIGDDRLVLAADLTVDITRAGIFKLSFPLPDGLDVEAMSGPALSQWTEAVENGRHVITMHLTGRTIGTQTFALTLSGAAPHAQPSWPVPRLAITEATRQSGQILLVPDQGIRLRAVARENVSQLDPQAAGDARPGVVSFRLLQQDYTLAVAVEALEPWVTVEALQEVTMREGQTLTRLAASYKVENAAVKQLRIRLPGLTDDQARTVRATGPAVSDLVRVPGAADEWEIRFQRGITGETTVQIEFQAQAASGRETESVLNPIFEAARQVTLFVAIRGSGRLELDAPQLPRGWERLDWTAVPANLQDRADTSVPALCFRVADPEGPLAVTVRRNELAGSLKVRVTKGTLTTIFSPHGPSLTSAELEADVVEKTTMRARLPGQAQLINVFVNGATVPVVQDGDAFLFCVSPGLDRAQQAVIRLVYSVPAAQSGGIGLSGPVLSVPMENVSWRVVMPAGYALAGWHGDLRLDEKREAGSFGVSDYMSSVDSTRADETRSATALLDKANSLLQSGDQQGAGEALDRVANANGLDAASNEDARVELRVLKTQQAVLGLNTRLQKLYLDNRSDTQRNEQIEQAASLNPLLQGRSNYDPTQFDQLLQGNTAEQNDALNGIASSIVNQQLAAEPAPGAIDVTIPGKGQVLTFTRSMQVDGNTPLHLDLDLTPLPRSNWLLLTLILLAIAIIAPAAVPTPIAK